MKRNVCPRKRFDVYSYIGSGLKKKKETIVRYDSMEGEFVNRRYEEEGAEGRNVYNLSNCNNVSVWYKLIARYLAAYRGATPPRGPSHYSLPG